MRLANGINIFYISCFICMLCNFTIFFRLNFWKSAIKKNHLVPMFFFEILIEKMGVEINLGRITTNSAADSKKGFPVK